MNNKVHQVKLSQRVASKGENGTTYAVLQVSVPGAVAAEARLQPGEYLTVSCPGPGQLLFDGGERQAPKRKKAKAKKVRASRKAQPDADEPESAE